MIAIWQKVTIHVANLLVVVELTTTIQIKKELANVTNELRTHLGLPAYTKSDSDSDSKKDKRI